MIALAPDSVRGARRAAIARLPLPRTSAACVLAVLAFAGLTTAFIGNAQSGLTAENIAEALVAVLATVACVLRAGREHRARAASPSGERAARTDLGWLLVAVGVALWSIGQIGWGYYDIVLGRQPPAVSVPYGGFLGFPVFVILGLLVMVRTPAGRLSQLRGASAAALIAAGMFLLSWSLILETAIRNASGPASEEAINLAFPALDAAAISAVLFVALRRKSTPLPGLGLLGAGIACIALSDSLGCYVSTAGSSFPLVSPFGTGWVAGFLLIGLGALQPAVQRSAISVFVRRPLIFVVPGAPAAAGLAVVLLRLAGGRSVESVWGLVAILAAVAAAALLLQVVVSFENHVLTSDLEQRVLKRTAELHATESYYRALVQHASDVVLAVDPDLHIRYVSDSVKAIFGYEPSELRDRDISVFGHQAAEALGEAVEHSVPSPGQISRVAWTLTDAGGALRHAESTVTNMLADPHVRAIVLNTRDETERVALQDQLRHRAFHDPLTELSNRALFNDRAAQAFARSLRTGAKVAVLAIDLDAFKLVNDSLGHRSGDSLLRTVAQRLQSCTRPEDTVARVGGDEFLILVEAVGSIEETLLLAERLREELAREVVLDGVKHHVSASIGVAVARAADTTIEQLLRNADIAMYSAKAGGKNAVRLFRSSMHVEAREHLRLQADLALALEREEFHLLYQPQFDLATGHLDGFEALLRWQHPRRGVVSPDRFIPLAEESGLVVPLGRWVMREALRQAASWEQTVEGGPISIAVNVSAVQLKSPSLLGDVEAALADSGVCAGRVVLEITESSLVEDGDAVIVTMHALKDLGVRIAIDDFGTGFASLSYLQNMPVDILKIDQAFVRSSNDSKRGRDLLEAIVSIARTLSLNTVAEGIEQPRQLAAVRGMGCDLVQGYLLGRPLTIGQARHLILEGGAVAFADQPVSLGLSAA